MKLYTERVQHIEDLCQRATADADEVLKCVAGDAAGQGLESSSPLTKSGLGPSYPSMTGLNDAVVASSPDDAVPGSSTCATVSGVEFSNWASEWPLPADVCDVAKEAIQSKFHLPLSVASTQLGVSQSYLKRLCRTHGIPRWPFRQVSRTQHADPRHK